MNENDLIKQKDTEIDILIRKNETLKDEVSELKAEVERLKNSDAVSREYVSICDKEIEDWKSLCNDYKSKLLDVAKRIKHIKSEARKEFAERASLIMVQFMMDELRIFIKDKCHDLDPVNDFNPTTEDLQGYVQSARKYLGIDNLLAEMESERE